MRNHSKTERCVTGVVAFSLMTLQSCVNPPQRASGVNPAPVQSPTEQPPIDGPGAPPEGGDVNRGTGLPPTERTTNIPAAEKVKVSYWLNPTDNSNCLTVQVAGAATQVTAPCTGVTRPSAVWVDNLYPNTGSTAFKLNVKVETTDKTKAKVESATDSPGDQAWRWRCVATQDPATKATVHTLCYEDGNTLAKTFESSDVLVQVVGAAVVDFGGIQCQRASAADFGTCTPK